MEGVRRHVRIDLVITHPAEWSEAAKSRTFQAVWQAGFNSDNFPTLGRITMVSEPEAAALYTFRIVRNDPSFRMRKGDSFVLCDAGGGTVDIISYQITQMRPEFKMRRIGYGSGGRCGGSFVDQNFRIWLRKKLGNEVYSVLEEEAPEKSISGNKVMSREL